MENNKNFEEFVVFRIADQEFCVEMGSTRELKSWSPTTSLPNSEDYVVGIINLRGTILPIINLAARLGLPHSDVIERGVVIVVQRTDSQYGILVDAVSDIISVGPDSVRPVPSLESDSAREFFKQVIVIEDRIICDILLDQLLPESAIKAA